MKTDSPNFYKPPTRLAVVKRTIRTSTGLLRALSSGQNGLSELLQASYGLGGGQNKLSTSTRLHALGGVKTESPNFYKHSTHLAAVKNGVTDLPKTLLRLDGGPNGLSARLLASYMLGDGQNGLSELLQASYTLGGGQTGLPYFNKPPTRLVGSKLTIRISTIC